MAQPDRRRRSRSGQLLDAAIWGIVLGAASGAVLGAAIDGVGAGVGALVGALLYAPAEALTGVTRGAAEVKPLWQRTRIYSRALLSPARTSRAKSCSLLMWSRGKLTLPKRTSFVPTCGNGYRNA